MKSKRRKLWASQQPSVFVDSVLESLILSLTDYYEMQECPTDPLCADLWRLSPRSPRYVDMIETDYEQFVATTSLIGLLYW